MKLYMHPASITSRIVRLYAADKGIALDEEVVDLFNGAHHQEPFVSINPNRLVPVKRSTTSSSRAIPLSAA